MSDILLDDVLMQLSLDAYRVAGQITTRTHESRTDGSRRLRPGRAWSRTPTQQALVDWETLGPAAATALRAVPPPSAQTAAPVLEALAALPNPPTGTSMAPRPEVVALARTMTVAAEMISTARYRPDFTAEHAATVVTRVTTAIGAISRVTAATAAQTADTRFRARDLRAFDALTKTCRVQPAPQGRVPGLVPAEGSFPSAVAAWCAATARALEPRQADARLMHSVPADLGYIHAATTLVLGASTLAGPPALDVKRAGSDLADAQNAWSHMIQSWPREAAQQPAGRSDHAQLVASQQLHEAIRDHLRTGSSWATPARIAQAVDAPTTLLAIADLGASITETARRYSDCTHALIEGGQVAFPLRSLSRRPDVSLEQDAARERLRGSTRGAWVPLPESEPVARQLTMAAEGAVLATREVERSLRPHDAGDFRDLTPRAARTAPSRRAHDAPQRARSTGGRHL